MAYYDGIFNALGLRTWCDADAGGSNLSMASLLAKTKPGTADDGPLFPFPSMDELHQACSSMPQSPRGSSCLLMPPLRYRRLRSRKNHFGARS